VCVLYLGGTSIGPASCISLVILTNQIIIIIIIIGVNNIRDRVSLWIYIELSWPQ